MRKPDRRILQQAMEWFVALQAEDCGDEEHIRFAAWLAQSEAHRAAYAEAERLWIGMDGLRALPRENLGALRQDKTVPRGNRAGRVAALLLAALAGGGAWLDWRVQAEIYVTDVGERRSLHLADGSNVDINANSRVSIRITPFRREIELSQGEALFEVAPERWRPFSVQAGPLNIRDIGTRFDVYKKPDGISVEVLEGKVELDDGHGVRNERVSAGYRRQYRARDGLGPAERIDPERAGLWKEGRLLFKRTPLAEVAAELERYHPVRFAFADPSLAKETISGAFAAGDLAPFLRAIEKILPVHAVRTQRHILLRRVK